MAFGSSQGDRAQVKEPFRQLQRIRAKTAEPAEPGARGEPLPPSRPDA